MVLWRKIDLKGLNGQDKPRYYLYIQKRSVRECSLIDLPLSMS